jgi:hypothetical protein
MGHLISGLLVVTGIFGLIGFVFYKVSPWPKPDPNKSISDYEPPV